MLLWQPSQTGGVECWSNGVLVFMGKGIYGIVDCWICGRTFASASSLLHQSNTPLFRWSVWPLESELRRHLPGFSQVCRLTTPSSAREIRRAEFRIPTRCDGATARREETRTPITRIARVCAEFGIRTSFGFRPSEFGFETGCPAR